MACWIGVSSLRSCSKERLLCIGRHWVHTLSLSSTPHSRVDSSFHFLSVETIEYSVIFMLKKTVTSLGFATTYKCICDDQSISALPKHRGNCNSMISGIGKRVQSIGSPMTEPRRKWISGSCSPIGGDTGVATNTLGSWMKNRLRWFESGWGLSTMRGGHRFIENQNQSGAWSVNSYSDSISAE
jgi:hypothetical protein